jgi:aminoglycoside 6'-N-acetyltransferase I
LSSRYGLEIRSVQSSDAQFLADFMAGAGHSVAAPELARRLEALRTSPGVALMASDWGPPIGLIALHWSPSLFTARPTALMIALLVSPEARRRGIGRALLKAGSQAARSAGCDELHLVAPEGCSDLVAFAHGAGFAAMGAVLTRALRKGAGR